MKLVPKWRPVIEIEQNGRPDRIGLVVRLDNELFGLSRADMALFTTEELVKQLSCEPIYAAMRAFDVKGMDANAAACIEPIANYLRSRGIYFQAGPPACTGFDTGAARFVLTCGSDAFGGDTLGDIFIQAWAHLSGWSPSSSPFD